MTLFHKKLEKLKLKEKYIFIYQVGIKLGNAKCGETRKWEISICNVLKDTEYNSGYLWRKD